MNSYSTCLNLQVRTHPYLYLGAVRAKEMNALTAVETTLTQGHTVLYRILFKEPM